MSRSKNGTARNNTSTQTEAQRAAYANTFDGPSMGQKRVLYGFSTSPNPVDIMTNAINNLNEFKSEDKYLIFSGIGNHQTFVKMIKNYGLNIFKDHEFPDHYKYTDKDINNILNEANDLNCKIITTEKDYLRINAEKKSLSNINFIKSELKIIDEKKLIECII